MKGVCEPLLWIALASPLAFLPFPPLALPISAALALSIHALRRTRLGQHAHGQLLVALVTAWLTLALEASVLLAEMLRFALPVPLVILLAGLPLTVLALAHALQRMADVAALEDSALGFSAIRLLFAGSVVLGMFNINYGVWIALFACPGFAYLVLRMRTEIALPNAR